MLDNAKKQEMKETQQFYSVKLLRFLMSTVGFWTPSNKREKQILDAILVYTVLTAICGIWIAISDLAASVDDFYAMTYTACTFMPVLIVLFKLSILMPQRESLLTLIKYSQETFWFAEYDAYGKQVIREINRRASVIMTVFAFFVQTTIFIYLAVPIIENIGKNESEKSLPFNIYIGVPLTMSPVFEIIFVFQSLVAIHTGLCFCCFDQLLYLINTHVAGQFRMLKHQLENIVVKCRSMRSFELEDTVERSEAVYAEFEQCILRHRKLLRYVNRLEKTFSYSTLCQMLVSGAMLCVAGFQVLLGKHSLPRKLLFVAHTNGCFFQLFVITVSSNEVMLESDAIGDGAYQSKWEETYFPLNKRLRYGVLMLMVRSMQPCCVTAGGFFPVSLETFMTVLSTSVSYFTLLRKFDEEKA